MIPKEYASFFEGFVQLVKACGFAPHDAQSMTRELEGSHEQLTLWIHPRQPGLLHAHVKTSRSPHAVHLRLFDPHWKPERVLPGHLGKGFDISNPQQLKETALLLEELWPRIEHWFSNPISGEALMLQQGVAPFNVNQDELERHQRRAQWLKENGREEEASFVSQVIAGISEILGDLQN